MMISSLKSEYHSQMQLVEREENDDEDDPFEAIDKRYEEIDDEEQSQMQIFEREETDDEDDRFEAIDKLISLGINAGDVKTLQDAGIYTYNGLMMHAKKSLTGIRGLSGPEVEKICAAENLMEFRSVIQLGHTLCVPTELLSKHGTIIVAAAFNKGKEIICLSDRLTVVEFISGKKEKIDDQKMFFVGEILVAGAGMEQAIDEVVNFLKPVDPNLSIQSMAAKATRQLNSVFPLKRRQNKISSQELLDKRNIPDCEILLGGFYQGRAELWIIERDNEGKFTHKLQDKSIVILGSGSDAATPLMAQIKPYHGAFQVFKICTFSVLEAMLNDPQYCGKGIDGAILKSGEPMQRMPISIFSELQVKEMQKLYKAGQFTHLN